METKVELLGEIEAMITKFNELEPVEVKMTYDGIVSARAALNGGGTIGEGTGEKATEEVVAEGTESEAEAVEA